MRQLNKTLMMRKNTYLKKKKKEITQFECSSQSSDDSDRVGGVCAELVQWGEESIPLVL